MSARAEWNDDGRLRNVDIRFFGARPEDVAPLQQAALNAIAEWQPGRLESPRVEINGGDGNVYIGQIAASLQNIDSTISAVTSNGDPQMATALKELERAVLAEQGLDDDLRGELLENVEDLADAAKESPEKRRQGRIRAALSYLTAATTTGGEIAKAMEEWGPIVQGLVS